MEGGRKHLVVMLTAGAGEYFSFDPIGRWREGGMEGGRKETKGESV
jgi:hypothetical protein